MGLAIAISFCFCRRTFQKDKKWNRKFRAFTSRNGGCVKDRRLQQKEVIIVIGIALLEAVVNVKATSGGKPSTSSFTKRALILLAVYIKIVCHKRNLFSFQRLCEGWVDWHK